MSAHVRRPAQLRRARRGLPGLSVLTLGLLVAAGAAPAAAVPDAGKAVGGAGGQGAANPGNQGSQGNQGTPPGQGNDGNQGNTDPGGDTSGNNTPGINEAGHSNGGTGRDAGVDPDLTLGSAMAFELRLATSGAVPPGIDLSGAEFSFADATTHVSAGTCTTDAAGTCTVHWGVPASTQAPSVVVLPYGIYEVTQSTAPAVLAPADGLIGRFSFCVVLCDEFGVIPVTNASLYRTHVDVTVVDEGGHPVAGREFSLSGQGSDAGPATSDADGGLSFTGFFAPGSWTFTPTTPVAFETLPAQQRTLSTTAAEAADPWAVSLLADALVRRHAQVTEEQGAGDSEGVGATGGGTTTGGDTGGTGTTGGETGGTGTTGGETGGTGTTGGETGGTGTEDTDTGGSDGGDSDVVDSGTEGPVVVDPGTEEPGTEHPGTDHHGSDHPGTGNPGSGNPGTEGSGTGGSGSGGSGTGGSGTRGRVADTQGGGGGSVDEADEETAASTPSNGSATPSRRPADAGDPILLAEAPRLETVSFREAGLVSSGFVLVALVFLGFLLYRRRSRRQD